MVKKRAKSILRWRCMKVSSEFTFDDKTLRSIHEAYEGKYLAETQRLLHLYSCLGQISLGQVGQVKPIKPKNFYYLNECGSSDATLDSDSVISELLPMSRPSSRAQSDNDNFYEMMKSGYSCQLRLHLLVVEHLQSTFPPFREPRKLPTLPRLEKSITFSFVIWIES